MATETDTAAKDAAGKAAAAEADVHGRIAQLEQQNAELMDSLAAAQAAAAAQPERRGAVTANAKNEVSGE